MQKVKKIYIASDPLMTKETEQFSNRRWLKDLLFRPILRATGIAPETLASSRTDDKHINRSLFFNYSGIDVDLDETQFWYEDSKISAQSLNYLSNFVNPETLVIGYELSKQTRNLLSRLSVPYIDIWLHPIRFLDDVLFGFNSNIPKVRSRLFDFDLPEDQMYLYADRIRIQTYKGWKRNEADIKPDSALFIGQMMNDKSVCLDGRMLNVLDFKKRFEEIASQHTMVYYARHPYLRSGDEEIIRYLKSLGNVELTDVPSYRLLASQRIKKVFGLSSSMIHEAKYFNKHAEFLFRPIVEFGDKDNPNSFSSVFQEFISPHFWSHVLHPIAKTNPCPRVMFLDPKDKVRDMLGFYWGYPEVDKVEHMRRSMQSLPPAKTAAAMPAKTVPAKKRVFPVATGFIQSEADLRRLTAKIDDHDTVSFDIFDTLVERIVDQPNDIHRIMERPVRSLTNGLLNDFPTVRRESRRLALSLANNEEVLLKDRYKVMAEYHGLTEELATELHQLELELEKNVCRPRFLGRHAFEYARSKNKRIVLISDTYFDRSFVLALLRQCGYEGWDELYLSSDLGLLKQTGNLFDRVLELERKKPERMLHIGDNPTADIEMAMKRGISTFHVPPKSEVTKKLSPILDAFNEIQDSIARSLVKGLASRKITSGMIPASAGFTHGDAGILGYALLGPMFFGFAKWILDRSIEEGITDLYFLARDGEIAKRCYDMLAVGSSHAPRSRYVLASRRSSRVANIHGAGDIMHVLELNFTPCSLSELLENRFGINASDISEATFKRHGFKCAESLADWKAGESSIRGFFSDGEVVSLILSNACMERELLVQYYNDQELCPRPNRRIGFVDIGHSGSLQSSISQLMGLKQTVGFYFATTEDIDRQLADGTHRSHGYVVDRMKSTDQANDYRRHILMFELVFQNTQNSFICMRKHGKSYNPVFLDGTNEQRRISMIRAVHNGVCEFLCDMVDSLGALVLGLSLSGWEATAAYRRMLDEPWPKDVELFRGVVFENVYSARARRWIIPPKGKESNGGLWKEGMQILTDRSAQNETRPTVQRNIIRITSLFMKNEKKLAKLHRDPRRFFLDSRHGIVKLVGKTFMG